MAFKRNLFFLFSITLFAIASTVLNIFNYNPYQANLGIFLNFYTSFLIALTGIVSMFIIYIKLKSKKTEALNKYFWPSVRMAFFVSLGVDTLLILKGMKLLDLWVGVPLMIAIVLLELFFQTNKSKRTASI